MIQARTLQDLHLPSLEIMKYDGKNLPPLYEPAEYKGPEPTAEIEDAKIYTGSCHCGAITMAMKIKGGLSGEGLGEVHESEYEVRLLIPSLFNILLTKLINRMEQFLLIYYPINSILRARKD